MYIFLLNTAVMDVIVRVLLLALFCLLPHKTSLAAAREYKYVNEGDTITLRCSTENVSLASWYGPSQTTRTFSQYFNGQSRSQALIKSVSIQVYTDATNGYESYNLVISNISTEMGGDYRCQRSQHNSEETLFYTVVFIENPSVVKIDGNGQVNGEKIYWREDILITVTCSTEQDISVMNISWYKHGSRVKSGESNTLTWSFVPTRTDNNRTITCEVYITQQKRPLVKTLILDIEYDPVVIFETIPKELIEGRSFEISCDVDGHPPVDNVHIEKGNESLTSCNGSSCSYRLNGTRQDSGTYTCHVSRNLVASKIIPTKIVNVIPLSSVDKYKYVNEGDTTFLPCSTENVSLASWYGPSLTTPYFIGLTRNSNLNDLVRMKNTKEEGNKYQAYNLVLENVSTVMEGEYKCLQNGSDVKYPQIYTIVIIEKPFILEIFQLNQTDDDRIKGSENESLEVVCRLKQDVSVMNISWYRENSLVKSGESNTLDLTFVPTRTDNNKTAVCVVYIFNLETPLMKSVILDIKYLRVGVFETKPKEIIEGRSFEISCYGDGNPPVELVYIKKGKDRLNICRESTSCSYKLNGTRQDSGTYTCHVFSSLKKDESTSTRTVNVLYSPDVTVYHQVNAVYCNAKGNPNNISFVAWHHFSEFGNLIRSFNGSVHLDINSYKRYATNGNYTCEATNGIPDMSGNTVKSGGYSVLVNGIPEILPNTQMIQYGQFREPFEIILFAYSVPPITAAGIYKPKTIVLETRNVTSIYRNITIIPFENQFVLKGYEIRLKIHSLTKKDIGNHTFVIGNKIGKTNCTILVLDKDTHVPSPPLIQAVSSIDNDVLVSFQQTSNDGLLQQFVVEYRMVYEDTWTSAYIINNTLTEPYFVTIHGLEYAVEYCVQVYGINDAGRGNSTEVCSIKTANNSIYMYTLVILPVGISFLCAYFGLRKWKKIQSWILRRNSSSHPDNNHNEQELQDYPPLDSPHMVHNDMYSMPNRNLAYVELDLSENTGRFHIRGEERTNYSDIEYFRVGPPASSSSSEDGDDGGDKDNDDFMSLEEIADMMKGRGANALSDSE